MFRTIPSLPSRYSSVRLYLFYARVISAEPALGVFASMLAVIIALARALARQTRDSGVSR
jgi:hypothetical protein